VLKAQGWNTWDVHYVNAVVHLETRIEIIFGLFDPQTNEHRETFTWRENLHRLGHHSLDGRYASISLKWHGTIVTFEFASDGDQLAARFTAIGTDDLYLTYRLKGAWGAEANFDRLRTMFPTVEFNPSEMRFRLDKPVTLAFSVGKLLTQTEAVRLLERQKRETEAEALRSGGWLEDSADAMMRAIAWNTIYEPIKGRICTSVSRDWCRNTNGFGDYVLFCWDTFFCALMAQQFSSELAVANVRAILQEITPDGFVPNFGAANGSSIDRSQPPVGAYCVLKIYHASALYEENKNRALLEETYPALVRWHEWWLPNRDGNGDGLLEWGSNPVPEGVRSWESNNLKAAMYESGLDNSPMWDDVTFNTEKHVMELTAVDLNSLYALDAWSLLEIARILGKEEEAEHFYKEGEQFRKRITEDLWDFETLSFLNKHWDGRWSKVLSSTHFFVLLALKEYQWNASMVDHLVNPEKFWLEHVVPTVPKSEASFTDQQYWRGRIWAPHNYLVYEGLRLNRFDKEAFAFAQKSLATYLKEWHDDSHIHENINAITGKGDSPSSEPVYTWGALMGYIAHQEVVDVDAFLGSWQFGNLSSDFAELNNITVAEGKLSVQTGAGGLVVRLNGDLLFRTDIPVIMYRFPRPQGVTALYITNATSGHATLTVGNVPEHAQVYVAHQPVAFSRKENKSVEVSLTFDNKSFFQPLIVEIY
jgi:putative isomerase